MLPASWLACSQNASISEPWCLALDVMVCILLQKPFCSLHVFHMYCFSWSQPLPYLSFVLSLSCSHALSPRVTNIFLFVFARGSNIFLLVFKCAQVSLLQKTNKKKTKKNNQTKLQTLTNLSLPLSQSNLFKNHTNSTENSHILFTQISQMLAFYNICFL